MKKAVTLLLALVLVFVLTACGGGGGGTFEEGVIVDAAKVTVVNTATGMEVPYGSTVDWSPYQVNGAAETYNSIDELLASVDWNEVFGDLAQYKVNKQLNVLYIPSWAGAEYFINSFAVWEPYLAKYKITLTMQGPKDYTDAAQLEVVESALNSGNYDAIILYPITPESYASYMDGWWETYKTPILTLGYGPETGGGHYFLVTSSARTKGVQMAAAIFDYANQNAEYFSKYEKIPYVLYQESSTPGVKIWLDTCVEILAKDGRFECVAAYEVSSEKALQATEALMVNHPEIEILITQADDSAVIATNTLKNQGKDIMTEKFSIWSQGGTQSALASIREGGYFKGTASSLNSYVGAIWKEMIPMVVGAAEQGKLLDTKAVMESMMAGSLVFTKENMDKWDSK